MKNEEQILAILKVLAQGQAEIQADISGLKQGQTEMQQQTNQRFDTIDNRLDNLTEDVETVKEDVEIVRQVATKTEYDLGQQTAIIREGFYDNQKLADNYEPRISKLEDAVENLSIDVNYIKSVI